MFIRLLLVSLMAFTTNCSVLADTWRADLTDGGEVRVDSQTHKPTLYYGGSTTPLWNGVHKLDDGSVIIVRDGVVVPNETIYQTWTEPPAAKTIQPHDECAELINRTCGNKNGCAARQPCTLAKQLQQLVISAQNDVSTGVGNGDQDMCKHGLLDVTMFPPCEQEIKVPTPCTKLVTKTCGDKLDCQTTTACNVAQQLLKLGQEAHLNNPEVPVDPQISQQCEDALNNAFFSTCQSLPPPSAKPGDKP